METSNHQQESTGSTSAEDVAKENNTNNEGWQQSLVNTFLGFGTMVGNSIAAILYNAQHISLIDGTKFAIAIAVSALVLAIFLYASKHCADWLNSESGNKLTIVCILIGSIGSPLCYILGLNILGAVLPCITIVSTVVLFCGCLLRLPRKMLMILVNLSFMYAGAAVLFCASGYEYGIVVICIVTIVSLVFVMLFEMHYKEYRDTITVEDSKKNVIKLKGNNTTLFLIGFMLGLVAIVFVVAESLNVAFFVIGASVLLASLISFIADEGCEEKKYKNFMLKSMAAALCIILVIQFLPKIAQLVVLGLFLTYVFTNLIIVINAIVETARFDLISLVWLIGSEGFVLAAGITCGAIVVVLSDLLGAVGVQNTINIAVVISCFLGAVLQMRINYQVYPFEPMFEAAAPEATPEIKSAGRQKALWQRKVDTACTLYRLSPREIEVLHILLKGRDTKYIMEKFVVSQSTAKTHIYNIYRKFDIHSRQELLDFIEDIVVSDEAEDNQED